jgi:hypothetical protein
MACGQEMSPIPGDRLPRTILLPGNIQSGVLGSPAIEVQGT